VKPVLEVLVGALVDHPEEVEVIETSRSRDTVFLEVRVAPGDVGKIIGKQGKIANAIRTVARAAAARERLRAMIDITS
jgi:predicted RNA-binding protein YlqC (UPF0109 family)